MEGHLHPPIEPTFVIHLWREADGGWRGHVTDGADKYHFEDGASLAHIMSERLRLTYGVPFPLRRSEAR